MEQEMRRTFKDQLATAYVKIRFTTRCVGGQPGGEEGVRAYVEHHLKLTGDGADSEVNRILNVENVPVEENIGELEDVVTYAVNVWPRNDAGEAWMGTWKVQAMMKQVASRMGLFSAKGKIGSKGDLSEGALITPHGDSMRGRDVEIYAIHPSDNGVFLTLDERIYERFQGTVSTAQGRKSIQHDSEVIPAGWELHFKIEWPTIRIKPDDMAAIWGMAPRVGMGSVKPKHCGRFEVLGLDIDSPDFLPKDSDGKKATAKTKAK
jgi:hypothetical protein